MRGGYRARCLAGQLREAYVVLTQTGDNGYSVSNALAVEAVRDLALAVPVLPEPSSTVAMWAVVLQERGIVGLRAHDAWLVAVAREIGAAILTDDRNLAG